MPTDVTALIWNLTDSSVFPRLHVTPCSTFPPKPYRLLLFHKVPLALCHPKPALRFCCLKGFSASKIQSNLYFWGALNPLWTVKTKVGTIVSWNNTAFLFKQKKGSSQDEILSAFIYSAMFHADFLCIFLILYSMLCISMVEALVHVFPHQWCRREGGVYMICPPVRITRNVSCLRALTLSKKDMTNKPRNFTGGFPPHFPPPACREVLL